MNRDHVKVLKTRQSDGVVTWEAAPFTDYTDAMDSPVVEAMRREGVLGFYITYEDVPKMEIDPEPTPDEMRDQMREALYIQDYPRHSNGKEM